MNTPLNTPELVKAKIAGFINQDMVGRKVDGAKAAAFCKRAMAAIEKRCRAIDTAKESILKDLTPAGS